MANPAYPDAGNYHSVRCSQSNPQHVHVHQILMNLNLDVFKSKNQYMIDAIEWYDKYLNEELPEKENVQRNNEISYNETETLKKEIIQEVMQQVQREIIALLGTAIGGARAAGQTVPVQNTQAILQSQQMPVPAAEQMAEKPAVKVNKGVIESVNLWGNDFDEEEL